VVEDCVTVEEVVEFDVLTVLDVLVVVEGVVSVGVVVNTVVVVFVVVVSGTEQPTTANAIKNITEIKGPLLRSIFIYCPSFEYHNKIIHVKKLYHTHPRSYKFDKFKKRRRNLRQVQRDWLLSPSGF
jgi:heme/copper-type cytochrome/quinol oxidase subunit 2